MKRRRRNITTELNRSNIDDNYFVDAKAKDQILYWSLSMLIGLNGHREFVDKKGDLNSVNLAYFLDLDDFAEDKMEYERKDVITHLAKSLNKLDEIDIFSTPDILNSNLEKIQDMLQLNEIEMDILTFSIYIHYYDVFDSAADTLGNELTSDKVEHIFASLLGYTKAEVKEAFSPKSRLAQSGLVMMYRGGTQSLKQKLEVISDEFIDKMMTINDDIEEMIRNVVKKCSPAELSLMDFKHLDSNLKLLTPYLDQAIKTKQNGINILLYGAPGTGKTELSKAIAKELDMLMYEVSYTNENDEPIEGWQRLKAYKVAQSFFAQKKLLLMFDEVEDVFSNDDDFSVFRPKRQKNKAWINRTLETNALPTIWITNDVRSIDKALVRRFDMSIEVPVPPRQKRQEIIQSNSENLLSPQAIKKISKDEHIAPALITRAAKVIERVKDVTEDTSQAFELLINNTLNAQGYGDIKDHSELELPESYNPSLNNTSLDLIKLARGIKVNPSARLCFYGVPGTGKSAFGKWLAQELDKPFLLKTGSDLISMWVGGTEKNIASAFREAKDEDAVLVFDEVDSFLQDRRTAKQSWEVTQVNEMLVQMENYNGIFIATTNLMDGLDQASLRRFDLKLEFGYLKCEQAWKMFLDEAKQLKLRKPTTKVQYELQKISNLAPGDFAAVRRQHRFNPLTNAIDLLERLKEDCAVKEQSTGKTMGFLAS